MFKKSTLRLWRDSIPVVILCFLGWLGCGLLLSTPFFDRHFSDAYKPITSKADALTFVAITFTLLIPVFILLLQRMIDAGYLNRLVLPRIIRYREMLAGYFTLSFLLLLSPRAAYYYEPVIGVVLISVPAIGYSLLVLFDMKLLRDDVEQYVKGLVKQYFDKGLKNRQAHNDFFEQLKNTVWIRHSWLDPLRSSRQDKVIEARSPKKGYLHDVNIKKLDDLMSNEFSAVNKNEDADTSAKDSVRPRLVLSVRPGNNIESGSVLMALVIPDGVKMPNKDFIAKLQKTFNLDPSYVDSTADALSDLTIDVKQQLRDAIDSDNVVLVQQALTFYKLLTEGLDKFSKEQGEDIYGLADARQEYKSFWVDDMAKELQEISQLIGDEFVHSLRDARQETARELTGFMYHDLLKVTEKNDVLAIARADQSFNAAIASIIYGEYVTTNAPTFQKQIIDSLLFRLKEHTDLLVYYLADDTDRHTDNRKLLEDWLSLRFGDIRNFMLATYKNSQVEIFKLLLQVFTKMHDDIYTYPQSTLEVFLDADCTLFIILAYMSGRSNESDEQKEAHQLLDGIVSGWRPDKITQILVRCVDKDYSDSWRIDTYDLVADGEMHDVPDFSEKMKSIWVEKMLRFETFPQDVSSYRETPINTTLTFSQGGLAEKDNYLLKYLDASKDGNSPQLKTLVKTFIAARKDWEDNQLAAMQLSKRQVSETVDAVLKGYKNQSISYPIFKQVGSLHGGVSANGQFKYTGWNELKDKAAFVDNWHISYFLPADQYGFEIAKLEDGYVFATLFKNVERLEDKKKLLSLLRSRSNDSWVLLLVNTGNWFLQQFFGNELEPNLYADARIKRVRQLDAIKTIYNKEMQPGLYAVRSKDLGTLKFKQPLATPVEVDISAYSHDTKLRNAILAKPPEWLQKQGDKSAQEAFLKTKARLFISHVMRYVPKMDAKTYYLPLKED